MTAPPAVLDLEVNVYTALLRHLLPSKPRAEEAAFVFARAADRIGSLVLRAVAHEFVEPAGFGFRSVHALELSDETRGRIIKRAHDLGAAVVEFHSHPFPSPAEFSGSDRAGLDELVPHMLWRLKGRPYVAVVVSPDSFDALVWTEAERRPATLDGIRVGTKTLRPTGRSERSWR